MTIYAIFRGMADKEEKFFVIYFIILTYQKSLFIQLSSDYITAVQMILMYPKKENPDAFRRKLASHGLQLRKGPIFVPYNYDQTYLHWFLPWLSEVGDFTF